MQYEILVSRMSFTIDQDGSRGADKNLEIMVHNYIDQGWRPQGGVSTVVLRRSDNTEYSVMQQYQAMVKD